MLHQPQNTVSPARRRWAKLKPGRAMMSAPALAACLDVGDRLRHELGHSAADLMVGLRDALGVEVAADLVQHIVIARLLEIGHHHRFRVILRLGAAEAEFFRRPQTDELVAPRGRLELEFLIVRELLLEAFLALIERGHASRPDVAWNLATRLPPCISGMRRQGNRDASTHRRCGARGAGLCRLYSASRSASLPSRRGCVESHRPLPPPRISIAELEPRHPMDFTKPRYTPMSRRRRIYEGKAKVLYEGPEPGTLIQHFKDDATAFNAKKHEVIEGKGVLNNRISEYVFQHLNDIGVPTHFIRRLNMREQLIREVEIIPLEVVVRNVAAGSLSQRLGIEEGTQLPRSIIEFYYKNDALGDPMVSEEHVTAFGWATPQEIDDIMALAIRVNDFLSGLFLGVGIRLVDFKMECGRLWENDMMRIVVADEISPDSCRLWDIKSNEKLDKDRFRRDLGGLLEAYTEVAKRLGVMSENERPQGTGPILVKG